MELMLFGAFVTIVRDTAIIVACVALTAYYIRRV